MTTDGADDGSRPDTDFGAIWSSDGVTRSLAPSAAGLPADLPYLFAAGQRFGPYLIVRPLGKGGMGQVYEAEEAESGRRVAIKILGRGIGDEEERERFLAEGRLAASLSHPNCVYVFGTSEVQGFPVIAMELAPSGTLKDQLPDDGRMPVAAAVDVTLQVIAGLEAAASIGILHRDIKPSNCFVAADGRVMIGDFGLSMAASAHGPVAQGSTISGTPGFASPEQLRGEPLDVRSDIYSVGATLFYLLSGRMPVERTSTTAPAAGIAVEAAPPLGVLRPDLPRRLASVVARCLAPTADARFPSYAALAAALEPFRSTSTTAAPLTRRLVAGIIDVYAASLPLMPFNLLWGAQLLRTQNFLLLALPSFFASVLYYGLLEGYFGCAAGKALLNLRVVDRSQLAPGIRRGLLRALVYLLPQTLVSQLATYLVLYFLGGGRPTTAGNMAEAVAGLLAVAVNFFVLVGLFSPVRRRNGYAAVHDRLSGTRVVLRPKAFAARGPRTEIAAASAIPGGSDYVGPYVVTAQTKALIPDLRAPLVVDAYDARLRRGVWLRLLPDGTPALSSDRRDVGRATRARWLSGRRRPGECWDAYEAIPGQPLLEIIAVRQPWSRVRHWVGDLAQELAAGLGDGSLPPLTADRVWIGTDDRARLLDWPAGDRGSAAPAENGVDLAAAQRFLYAVAAGALRGLPPDEAASSDPQVPLPIAARSSLLALRHAALPDHAALAAEGVAVLRGPATFQRRPRLMQLAANAAIPAMIAVSVFAALRLQLASRSIDSNDYRIEVALGRLETLNARPAAKLTPEEATERDLLETYIGERLREEAEDQVSWVRAFPATASAGAQRKASAARRALDRPRQSSPDVLQRADAAMADLVARNRRSVEAFEHPVAFWGIVAMVTGGAALVVACIGLLGALLVRGGFTLRALGAAVVRADGRDASRLRVLWRTLVAWSPLVIWLLVVRFGPPKESATVGSAALYTLSLLLLLAGAVVAALNPSRGIQDRLAGTWLVPR